MDYTKWDIKFLEDRVRSRHVHRKDDDVEHLLTILDYERAASASWLTVEREAHILASRQAVERGDELREAMNELEAEKRRRISVEQLLPQGLLASCTCGKCPDAARDNPEPCPVHESR